MNEAYLIQTLSQTSRADFPNLPDEQRIRSLMNITMSDSLSEEFYRKQDEYLQELLKQKEIVDVESLPFEGNIILYRGDITLLKADAIVNAGNSQLLGCFVPLHLCIDNCIHSFAGLEVRRDLMQILQGREVANAEVVVTKGYNLPSHYIFHTVGPIYSGIKQDAADLAACYTNCLDKASKMGLKNIVFCSLSTGVFGFPIEKASRIAVKTVKEYQKEHNTRIKVVFDVFSKSDQEAYERTMQEM